MTYIYPLDTAFAKQCLEDMGLVASIENVLRLARLNAQRFEPLTDYEIRNVFSSDTEPA